MLRFPIFLSLLFLLACASDPAPAAKQLPNTPEAVAKKWLGDYYNDRFEEAKELSTPATIAMIDAVKSMLFELPPDEEQPKIQIKDMKCETVADTSFCIYFYQEEGFEQFEESIELLKVKGQWLVNESQPDEDEF